MGESQAAFYTGLSLGCNFRREGRHYDKDERYYCLRLDRSYIPGARAAFKDIDADRDAYSVRIRTILNMKLWHSTSQIDCDPGGETVNGQMNRSVYLESESRPA